MYDDTIEKLKEFKYSDEKLKLKKVEFTINDDIFSEIITETLVEENELKEEFNEYAEAHFYFGQYRIRKRQYSEAKDSFDRGNALRNSVIYRYDSLLSWFYVLVLDIEAKQQQKPEYIELIKELLSSLNINMFLFYYIDKLKPQYNCGF